LARKTSEEAYLWRGDHLHKAQAEECVYDFLGLLYCFIVLLCVCRG